MFFVYSPYIIPLIAAGLVSALVAVYAWNRRMERGMRALLFMSLCILEWTFAYALEIAGANLETKYFWGVIQYFGIAGVSYGFLIFSISYTEALSPISRRFMIISGLIPALTIILAITTKYHGLIWTEYHVNRQGDFSALGVSYGAAFYLHVAYAYLVLIVGSFLIARAMFRKHGADRRQLFALLIAALAPWLGNILYLTGNSPIRYLDLTPFAFAITVAALAWASFEEMLTAKQSAENELEIARKIQISFLPASLPKVEGWDVDVRFESAREVAGDFYDVFPVSNGTRLGFVVADVCDKGVGAALYMAIFRTMIRAFAGVNVAAYTVSDSHKTDEEISTILLRKPKARAVGVQPLLNAILTTNQYIARNHGASNMFATVFFGILNPLDGKLIYINAGHEPPVLLSKDGIKTRLDATGPVVGMFEENTFEVGEIEMLPGDLLFVYTDGVTDAQNKDNQEFSEERLLSLLEEQAKTPETILKNVMSAVHKFIAEHDQFDDLTALSLYRK